MLSERQKALAWDGLKAAYNFICSSTDGSEEVVARETLNLMEIIENDISIRDETKRQQEAKEITDEINRLRKEGQYTTFTTTGEDICLKQQKTENT